MNQMGIKNLINRNAPAGEQVAFINEREADLLRRSGGSGRTDNNPYGIPSYYGGGGMDGTGGDYGDSDASFGGDNSGDSNPATGGPVDLTTPLNTRAPAPPEITPYAPSPVALLSDGKGGYDSNLGLDSGYETTGEMGFFEGIGNFLSRTASHIANNPGTFLMNTAVNLTPIGALANIASGLTTGSSIGTNISNTVGTELGFDPVAPSPFNQALGDVGKGVLSSLPDNFNIQDFLSQREPTSFSPEQARQLNAAASRIPNIGDPPVATDDPFINNPFGDNNNLFDKKLRPKGIY